MKLLPKGPFESAEIVAKFTETFRMRFTLVYWLLLLPAFASAQDWELRKNEDGIKVYTKKVSTSSFDAFKAEMEIKASVQDVVKLLKDIEHYDRIFPDMAESKLLKMEGDSTQIQYTRTDVPWPVSDRDGIYKMTFREDKKTGGVSTFARSVPDYLPEKEDAVRIQASTSSWRIYPVAEGKIHVEYEVQADPGGSIPDWLANSAVVDVPFETFEMLKAVLLDN